MGIRHSKISLKTSLLSVCINCCDPGLLLPGPSEVPPLTFVNDDARHLFLSRGRALDLVSLHQAVHLCEVLEGAVDARGKFGDVMGLQHQLWRGTEGQNEDVMFTSHVTDDAEDTCDN